MSNAEQLQKDLEEVIRILTLRDKNLKFYQAVAGAIQPRLLDVYDLDLSNDYFSPEEEFRFQSVYEAVGRVLFDDYISSAMELYTETDGAFDNLEDDLKLQLLRDAEWWLRIYIRSTKADS